MSPSVALLILRVLTGLLFIGHGTQKLFGWFGGHGLTGTGQWLESLGFRGGRRWALVTGLAETAGGLLLALGFLTPIGAAAIIGVMTVASVAVHWRNGLWVANGGFELPLVYAAIATALATAGPGAYSLEEALGWSLSDLAGSIAGWQYGAGAFVLGVIAGLAVNLLRRRAPLAPQADRQEPEPAHAA